MKYAVTGPLLSTTRSLEAIDLRTEITLTTCRHYVRSATIRYIMSKTELSNIISGDRIYRLKRPLIVSVRIENDQILITSPDLGIWGEGRTPIIALYDFQDAFHHTYTLFNSGVELSKDCAKIRDFINEIVIEVVPCSENNDVQ